MASSSRAPPVARSTPQRVRSPPAAPGRPGRPLHLGVEVLEAARRDAAGLDERVDVGLLEADDPPELVGRPGPLVDEPVQAAQGHAEALGRLLGAQPVNRLVLIGLSRRPRSADDRFQPLHEQAELVETGAHAVGVTPNRQAMARTSSARMVIIRPLKSCRWTWIIDRNRRSRSRSGPLTVCSLVRSMVTLSVAVPGPQRPTGARAGRSRRRRAAGRTPPVGVVVRREQLVDRHVVELGQALQPRHRDGPLAPLVGARAPTP